MIKISWREKQTNEIVFQSVEEQQSLVDTISIRKSGYYEKRKTFKICYRRKAGGKKTKRKKAYYDVR